MATDIYTLLSQIEKRPVMYLGETSLSLLEAFLNGYFSALETSELEIEVNPSFRSFQNWVGMKLQSDEGNVPWSYLLLRSCGGDEEKAFEKFFVYLEEFKNKEESVLLWVQLPLPSTRKTVKVLRPDGRYYREPPNFLIQIVEYAGAKGVFIRSIEPSGTLSDEVYRVDLERGLKYADTVFGVRQQDWISNQNREAS